MNKLLNILLILILALLYGCKTTQYVPVEHTKIEYRNHFSRDSIYLHDSVMISKKGDTIFVEKYKWFSRDRFVHDSIYIHDTIPIPYPLPIPKPYQTLTGWQNFRIWAGNIALGLLAIFLIYLFLKSKLK
jgi:hypothetical protein